jgi:hypothetical protein
MGIGKPCGSTVCIIVAYKIVMVHTRIDPSNEKA